MADKENIIISDSKVSDAVEVKQNFSFDDTIRAPRLSFASQNQLRLRDLNSTVGSSITSYTYTKDNIAEFLKNPANNEKNLRDAIINIYNVSPHFRRLIQYFASLTDLSYVVSPYEIDTSTAKEKSIKRNYRNVLKLLSSMDIKNQYEKVVFVCLREDVFYGTMWVTSDSIIVQQLPSDYCSISVIEDNVFNVSFNFSYFDGNNNGYLAMYPEEFRVKYNAYLKDRTNMKWQELDSPTSWAVKCCSDIPNYALPPFVGLMREVYDIEDYKQLKLTKTELENYAILVMKLVMNANGEFAMDYDRARDFWRNLDKVLPEEVGSVLSPMEINKIGFEKSNVGDTNTVSEAEQNLYSAAGASSLLFNNEKASANALALSIKVDQALTYGIVKGIEGVLNRFIHAQSYGKNFKVSFLDCSPFNRKEVGDAYIKACQYGLPMVSYYCASQGMSQEEMDCMNFLEDNVLNIKDRFIPLMSSATQSSSSNDVGRSEKDTTELTEAGEQTRENA